MNSAFDNHADNTAGRMARRAALACALLLGAGGAFAQQHGERADRRDDQGMQMQGQAQGPQRTERFRLPPQQGDLRQADPRQADARSFDDTRRMQQDQADGQRESRRAASSGSRMTPDERRDLRRQINEAGMDLYPQRRH